MATYQQLIMDKSGLNIGSDANTDIVDATRAGIYMAEGYKDIVNKVASSSPDLLNGFAKKINSGWENNKFKLENHYVFSVFRKGDTAPANVFRKCREVQSFQKHEVSDSNSIYAATEMDPVYFIEDRYLTVIPDHSVNSGEFEYLGIVSPDTLTAGDTYPTGPITDGDIIIPQDFCIYIVLYTAIKLVEIKLSKMNDSLSTMIDEDTKGEVPNLTTDSATSVNGWKAVRYYIQDEEDTELAGAKLQELNAEQQQWTLEYQWYQERLQRLKSEYLEPFASAAASEGAG